MRTITVACFSPTGGTRKAAQELAGRLGGDVRWLDLLGQDRAEVRLGEEDLLLLALPVYAGRIPAVEGLLDGLSGQNTPCVLLATYGNRHYDDALAQMKMRAEMRGFWCVGGAAVIAPHIFAPELGKGRPDEADCAVLTDFAGQVQDKLNRGDRGDVALPGNPEPEPKQAIPVLKKRNEALCVRCGLCAKRCPTGAMSEETLVWDTKRCISCMACVGACPRGAMCFDAAELNVRLTAHFAAPRAVEIFL